MTFALSSVKLKMNSQDIQVSGRASGIFIYIAASAQIVLYVGVVCAISYTLASGSYAKDDKDLNKGKLPKFMLIGLLVVFVIQLAVGIFLVIGIRAGVRSLLLKTGTLTFIVVFLPAIVGMAWSKEKV